MNRGYIKELIREELDNMLVERAEMYFFCELKHRPIVLITSDITDVYCPVCGDKMEEIDPGSAYLEDVSTKYYLRREG